MSDAFGDLFHNNYAVDGEKFIAKKPGAEYPMMYSGKPPLMWGQYEPGVVADTPEAVAEDKRKHDFYGSPADQAFIQQMQEQPEGSQITDQAWIGASKNLYHYMNPTSQAQTEELAKYNLTPISSESFTDEDYANWGVNFMSKFNYNITAMLFDVNKLSGAPSEVAASMYYLMETADRDGLLLENFKRGFSNFMTDPTTYVGLSTLGIGMVGTQSGKQLSKMAFKDVLKNIVINRGGSAAAVAGVESMAYSGIDNAARQGVKINAGQQDEANVGETALSLASGFVLGNRLTAGLPAVGETVMRTAQAIPDVVSAVGDELTSGAMYNNPVGVVADAVGSVMEQRDAGLISTRLPTAVKSTEDPLAENLTIGLAETKADAKLYEHNVNITKDYPNMRAAPDATTDETAEQFIEHAKENLLYLHDQVPEETRPRSQMWYDGARAVTDRWVEEYGIPDTSIAGVLAALSPQKDWYQNAALAEKTISIATQQKDTRATNEMIDLFYGLKDGKGKPVFDKPQYRPMIEAMQGKTYAELTHENPTVERAMKALFVRLYDQTYNTPEYRILSPEGEFLDLARNADGTPSKAGWGSLNEIGKAIGAIEANGDVNIISPLMGERHKVRNFYNNIYAPNSKLGEVTIDTHAVAAALLRPLSGNSLEVDHNFKNQSIAGRGTTKGSSVSGVNGNYGLYAEAYRRAAAERGILPRQMQSITWEAVRGLFTDTFKSNANNVAEIDAIWQKYKSGEIELNETRRQVNDRAGGINPPTWQ